jgi:hypothetical protein
MHVTPDFIMQKNKIPVTNMQTDNSKCLNFWKFRENCIIASGSLALPFSKVLETVQILAESRNVRI